MGTSDEELMNELKKRDHPHACGDKSSITALVASSMGSSPRVWGQADITDCLHSHSGIIPTRVGTRYTVLPVTVSVKDHPHACGDKFLP